MPEDRGDAGEGNVRVAVAVGRATGRPRATDPVLFLQGGPGVGGLTDRPAFLEKLRRKRDVVLVDQRGVGASRPSLECPEVDRLAFASLARDEDARSRPAPSAPALRACRARLVANGVDLAAYDTEASAADLADLRRALGYERWNVIGYSYGTRLALALARRSPEGIRSLVLDSPYLPNVDFYAGRISGAARAVDRLFDSCAADADCAARYPNLRARWVRVLDRFDARPPTERGESRLTGRAVRVRFDVGTLAGYLRRLLANEESIRHIPAVIAELERGQLREAADDLVTIADSSRASSNGLHLSVQCREELPFTDRNAVKRAKANAPPEVGKPPSVDYLACEIWAVPPAPASVKDPVESRIPTLILSGGFDPTTPPAWGRLATRTLAESYFYEFENIGHGVLYSEQECPRRLAIAFLRSPAREPEASCIARMEPPDWR